MTDVQESPPKADLHEPELYANRELSWIDFNQRVLELAEDERVPLLERVRFLSITTSNLDEFFMVRVAGVHDQVDAGIDARGPDGLSPPAVLAKIAERTQELQLRQSRQWEQHVRPALDEAGIRIVDCAECDDKELERVDQHFDEQVFPVLTPLAVGPGRPFPYISNLSLSLAVWLRDPESGEETFARVKVPKEVLPRFLSIGNGTYVPLETAIARHLGDLFPGMEILRHDYFRVTRDADFTVSDEADDLLQAVEDELRRRRFGEVVRLEVGGTMDRDLRTRLIEWLAVEEQDVVDVEGLLDLDDLSDLYEIEGHRDLRFEAWVPTTPPAFRDADDGRADVFAAMRERDLLVQHPYDSFAATTERFIQQAVADPDVLAIKMTVYRTSDDSALVPALIEAAERGKQAVCLVELKARFDERRNIGWARALEEAGAHVVHGLPGLKTHTKALLVVRREGSGVRHYVHVGTGNYHAKTARIYEDFGLFTTDSELAADVAELFNSLTGVAHAPSYRKAITAPDHMRDWFSDQVERTIKAHQDGEETRIVLKMNSLVDARCIRALYEASQAGVRIDLNVRGICCLRAGIEGVSENIRVISVVGRYLEHARVYSFQRGSEHAYWMGSADLMPRNLDTRVELLAPVEDSPLQAELDSTFEACLEDDTFGWELEDDGSWKRREGNTRAAQAQLMERALMRAGSEPAPA
jgi:polyphosphate kinase